MLQYFQYEIPFRTPFKTASKIYHFRKGVILHYKNEKIDLFTEASPLPGFSRESIEDVRDSLLQNQESILHLLEGVNDFNQIRDLQELDELNLPSVQFSLSMLSLFLLAEKKQKTIFDLFKKSLPSLKVNDIVGDSSISQMENRITESIQKGFQVIKIKAVHPINELAALLNKIQEKYPSVTFRLDGNQSWPRNSLKMNCKLFGNVQIQYVEEPVAIDKLNDIPGIQNSCCFPVAFDETVRDISSLKTLLQMSQTPYIIIKPMLLGNIFKIHETITEIRSSSKQIVCTTSLESMIGRSMVAIAASLIGDPNVSHGLNTGDLFATDLLPDFNIKNGLIKDHQLNLTAKSFQGIKTEHLKKLN